MCSKEEITKKGQEHFDAEAELWDQKLGVKEVARRASLLMFEHLPWSEEEWAQKDVLDFGCGTGAVGFSLAPRFKTLTGVDNSVSMLKIFRRKAEDRKLSNCWAPEAFTLSKETIDHLQGRKFDLIVTSLVLHHVADPTETLSMFRLLLKEGGYVVVIDFDVNEKNPHAMGSEEDRKKKGVHHPHGFSVEHMAKIFSSAGLDVIVSSNFQVENKIMLHHPQKDEKIEDGEMSVLAFFGKVHQ